ncbi:mitochondrial amidoxime reducing component 2-like [Asterias amurensis]|uniref:mitochondrial amidoxime reducing component 2-like n=1 Tax=Asterias amurensis TaxID=7602 RepID=UPI003AB337B1
MKIIDVLNLSEQQQQVLVAGAAVLATAGVASGAAWWWYRKTTLSNLVFKPVGKLSTIFIHPIKSCRGHEVRRAECTAENLSSSGLIDRHFAILDAENKVVSMRTEPSLALVQPRLSEDGERFILEAPGMDPLEVTLADITSPENPVFDFRIWRLDSAGLYCGQEMGDWISNFLQKPGCKLVYFRQTTTKDRILAQDSKWGQKFKSNEKVCGFSDFGPLMMLTEASMDDLNSRLEKQTTMRRFRPNFVVSGNAAFDEDQWKYVKIGDEVILRRSHGCGRCRMVTVDPETGVMSEDTEPLKTLKEYRMADKSDPDSKILHTAPVFGSNLVCEVAGTLCVGDIVYAAF